MPNVQVVSGVGNYNGIWGFKMAEGFSQISSIRFKDGRMAQCLGLLHKTLSIFKSKPDTN